MLFLLLGCEPDAEYQLWWVELVITGPGPTEETLESDHHAYVPPEEEADEESEWESVEEVSYSHQGLVFRVDRADDDSCIVHGGVGEWRGTCTDTSLDVGLEQEQSLERASTHASGYGYEREYLRTATTRVWAELADGAGTGGYLWERVMDERCTESDLWDPDEPVGAVCEGYVFTGYRNDPETDDCEGDTCDVHSVETYRLELEASWFRMPVDERADGLYASSNPPGDRDFSYGYPK